MDTTGQLDHIDKNMKAIRSMISKAAAKAGRDPEEILLLPAVKYASADEINYLCEHYGITAVGENRVNTLLEHYALTDNDRLKYHFIGSLQKNKVKYIYDKISLLHSLDSVPLADEIEKRCGNAGISLDCLIEINIANEESKGGVHPHELEKFVRIVKDHKHINIKGFMTMGPSDCSQDEYDEFFGSAYALMKYIWKEVLEYEGAPFVSMGMSYSLEPAICNHTSCVRIGRGIFGNCGTAVNNI